VVIELLFGISMTYCLRISVDGVNMEDGHKIQRLEVKVKVSPCYHTIYASGSH